MQEKTRLPARGRFARLFVMLFPMVAAGVLAWTAAPAEAQPDRYDPKRAGNPLRITAYALHPVGVLIDYGLMRPCFWVVQREPFSSIFGYKRPREYHDIAE
jgi:hypothetical protein